MENEITMEELLKNYDVKRIHSGDIIKGKVIEVNDKEVVVNIGYAFDGVISKEELTYDDRSPIDVVSKDEEIEVYVISPNDAAYIFPSLEQYFLTLTSYFESLRLAFIDLGNINKSPILSLYESNCSLLAYSSSYHS